MAYFLYKDIPETVYEVFLIILCLGCVSFLAFFGINKGLKYIARLVLVEYVLLLFASTVWFRTISETRGYNFTPFWSYVAIKNGKEELLTENVMNVLAFVPVGILLGMAFRYIKWWQALGIGCLISLSIEALQLVLKSGFAETDDVMHNTLGTILGFSMGWIFQRARNGEQR